MTNNSNNNHSNQYIYAYIYLSQLAFITDHNHISIPISLSYYLCKDILNLYAHFIYSFINTQSHIHSRILIHVYSFTNSFTYTHSYIHLRILIHVYSFTYTHSYIPSHIHSCILIHVYSFITSFTYTHSRILLSFVIIFWLYVIIIIYHLTTLCVHDIFPLMFTIMF